MGGGLSGIGAGGVGVGKRIGAEVGDGVGIDVIGLFVRTYENEVKLPVPDLDETTTPFSKTRTVHSSESPLCVASRTFTL